MRARTEDRLHLTMNNQRLDNLQIKESPIIDLLEIVTVVHLTFSEKRGRGSLLGWNRRANMHLWIVELAALPVKGVFVAKDGRWTPATDIRVYFAENPVVEEYIRGVWSVVRWVLASFSC